MTLWEWFCSHFDNNTLQSNSRFIHGSLFWDWFLGEIGVWPLRHTVWLSHCDLRGQFLNLKFTFKQNVCQNCWGRNWSIMREKDSCLYAEPWPLKLERMGDEAKERWSGYKLWLIAGFMGFYPLIINVPQKSHSGPMQQAIGIIMTEMQLQVMSMLTANCAEVWLMPSGASLIS